MILRRTVWRNGKIWFIDDYDALNSKLLTVLLLQVILITSDNTMCNAQSYVSRSLFTHNQCRTGIKGPGRELFDGGPILNNIELWGPCWTLVMQ